MISEDKDCLNFIQNSFIIHEENAKGKSSLYRVFIYKETLAVLDTFLVLA